MMINPSIIALIVGTMLTVGFAVYASVWGLQIMRRWDLTSGSALQLQLERRTYLISTIMAYLLMFEIFSLFLFIYTADHIHPMFIGAMCAAGSLNVNGFGYPALAVKMLSVVGCGVWLLVNQADSRAEDYPLIRFKYAFLFVLTAWMIIGAICQIAYFKGLQAQVITSCCGTLFSSDAASLAGDIAALPVGWTRMIFFLAAALHMRAAIHLLVTGRGGQAVGWCSGCYLMIAIVAVISFISIYYYELPTHHCPFDILQAQYHFVGYPLYAALFLATIPGIGIGVMSRYAKVASLAVALPMLMRRYTWVSLFSSLVFLSLAVYPMIFSDFMLTHP